jgi:hypothetical protein
MPKNGESFRCSCVSFFLLHFSIETVKYFILSIAEEQCSEHSVQPFSECSRKPIQVQENIGEITTKGQFNNMADFLAHKHLDLVINLPMRHGGARRVSSFNTHGMTLLAAILKRL